MSYSDFIERPPLGLMPEIIHKEQRHIEVCEAIKRYEDAGKEIPEEWRNERLKLFAEILEYRNQKSKQVESNKDWEILSMSSRVGEGWNCDKKMFEWYLKNGWEIRQVKRLSDNSVWAIGDEVGDLEGDYCINKTIEQFKINNDKMYVLMNNNCGTFSLEHIQKKPHKSMPNEETTTERILRERIKIIEDNYACLSYADIKCLAFFDDVENGILQISIDTLKSFIKSKLK